VRFDGEVGYVVTFKQIDPLFAIDLADPATPTVMSALKIPGFSSYLHPWAEGRLMGLGIAGDDDGRTDGLKLSMFDTFDPFDVTELTSEKVEFDQSEALDDHRAILVDPKAGLIGFPVTNWSSGTSWYVLYTYDADSGFALKGKVTVAGGSDYSIPSIRGVVVGANLYVCEEDSVTAYGLENLDKLANVELK
jgi:uncharacterized secreted protein with C-terminal beta-propeller domain